MSSAPEFRRGSRALGVRIVLTVAQPFEIAVASTGPLNRYPCQVEQPLLFRNSLCASLSTPSAMTDTPRARPW